MNRCFAFEPSENQADDTKGLIMIPNVGQLGFYMSTMISDFASELLTTFGGLVRCLFFVEESEKSNKILYRPKLLNQSKLSQVRRWAPLHCRPTLLPLLKIIHPAIIKPILLV